MQMCEKYIQQNSRKKEINFKNGVDFQHGNVQKGNRKRYINKKKKNIDIMFAIISMMNYI